MNYKALHKGIWNRGVVGICGINKLWIKEIPKLNKYNINSLYGGSLVLEHLLIKNNYNLMNTLKEYKGSKINLKPVYKVLKTYRKINNGSNIKYRNTQSR